MSYIFFDLEWNQGYPHSIEDKLDEIIQIGAYRLEQWDSQPEPFLHCIVPTIHKKLHHRVRKMLPLDMDTLKQAEGFRAVARKFFQWCGSTPVFFTWGNSDIRVLDMNLCWYGMEEFLELEIYDLQRAFDLMVLHTDQQAALKDAVETLGLGRSGISRRWQRCVLHCAHRCGAGAPLWQAAHPGGIKGCRGGERRMALMQRLACSCRRCCLRKPPSITVPSACTRRWTSA